MREPLKFGTIVQNKLVGLVGMVLRDREPTPEYPRHWEQTIVVLPPLSDRYADGKWAVGNITDVMWVDDEDTYHGILNDDV